MRKVGICAALIVMAAVWLLVSFGALFYVTRWIVRGFVNA